MVPELEITCSTQILVVAEMTLALMSALDLVRKFQMESEYEEQASGFYSTSISWHNEAGFLL